MAGMLPASSRPLALERRQFRMFLWLIGSLAFILLVVGVVLRQLYLEPTKSLITEDADAILFELAVLIGGTLLGTVIVGLIIDEYQSRFGQRSGDLSALVSREGIVDVYRSATDPRLLSDLESAITEARERVVGLGLGLGILHNNRSLLAAVANRVNASDHLRVEIYLGDEKNAGVQNRIAEEAAWHAASNVNYDPGWVRTYPNEIRSVLRLLVDQSKQQHFQVREVDSCPSIGIIQVDDRYFYFPYGPPSVRGSESPWMQLSGAGARDGTLIPFFHNCLSYYHAKYAVVSTSAPTGAATPPTP